MIKFSLIIPVYNKENSISITLDTFILNHNIPDDEVECICVNESSTDDSGKICEEYAKRYSYIKCYDILNDGINRPSNARNFGKRIASGKYVMFLDADDIFCKDFLKEAIDFLENNNEYDFYICNRNINGVRYIHVIDQFQYFGPSLSCCIFRKNVVDSVDFENIINEDIVYTKKILLAGYNYYYNENNKTSYNYVEENSQVIYDDKKRIEKYNNWICGPAEILQYNEGYGYCIDDNNELAYKPAKKIQNLDIFILNYCNLNCFSCSSFCPVVTEKEILSVDEIVKELKVVQRFRDDIKTLTILGGETMLHPNLPEILTITRKMFPNNEIHIITNGTLYENLFKIRDSIIKNNILCNVFLYPVDNSEQIIKNFKNIIPTFNLKFLDYRNLGFTSDHLSEKVHNETEKILQCIKRHYCTRLEGNRIYICHYMAYLKILKHTFGDKIKINNDDCFLEITDTTTIDDIYNFITYHIPNICYHCLDVLQEDTKEHFKYWKTVPWKKSNKDLSEFYQE